MAAIPPVFALAPALVDPGIIDYGTPDGKKIYAGATKTLFEDTKDLYDGKANKLAAFLHKLRLRGEEYGWEEGGILEIDTEIGAPVPILVRLLDHYGEITVDQVRAHVLTYINVPNRAAQDSAQLYQCLNRSITSEA